MEWRFFIPNVTLSQALGVSHLNCSNWFIKPLGWSQGHVGQHQHGWLPLKDRALRLLQTSVELGGLTKAMLPGCRANTSMVIFFSVAPEDRTRCTIYPSRWKLQGNIKVWPVNADQKNLLDLYGNLMSHKVIFILCKQCNSCGNTLTCTHKTPDLECF